MSMCEHGWRSELEHETGACPECRNALLVKLEAAQADRDDYKRELDEDTEDHARYAKWMNEDEPRHLATITRLEAELQESRSQWENLSQSHSSYMTLWEKAEAEKAEVIATCEDLREAHNASVKQMGGMADKLIVLRVINGRLRAALDQAGNAIELGVSHDASAIISKALADTPASKLEIIIGCECAAVHIHLVDLEENGG
jgi:chromosome segregation ATPase